MAVGCTYPQFRDWTLKRKVHLRAVFPFLWLWSTLGPRFWRPVTWKPGLAELQHVTMRIRVTRVRRNAAAWCIFRCIELSSQSVKNSGGRTEQVWPNSRRSGQATGQRATTATISSKHKQTNLCPSTMTFRYVHRLLWFVAPTGCNWNNSPSLFLWVDCFLTWMSVVSSPETNALGISGVNEELCLVGNVDCLLCWWISSISQQWI